MIFALHIKCLFIQSMQGMLVCIDSVNIIKHTLFKLFWLKFFRYDNIECKLC